MSAYKIMKVEKLEDTNEEIHCAVQERDKELKLYKCLLQIRDKQVFAWFAWLLARLDSWTILVEGCCEVRRMSIPRYFCRYPPSVARNPSACGIAKRD